ADLRCTAERSVNERIIRSEPIAETAADELASGGRRCPLEHVVLAVEEIGRIVRVRRHRLKSREAGEDRRGPLPSVADEIVHSPGTRSGRVRADGHWIPIRECEV